MVKIGPDGTFPLRKPISQGDLGGLYAGFSVLKASRLGVINFGDKPLQWFGGPPAEMRKFAKIVRSRILENFGMIPYDESILPLTIKSNHEKGVILVGLPVAAPMLAADPELWLALAQAIEKACDMLIN